MQIVSALWQRPRAGLAVLLWPGEPVQAVACRPTYLGATGWILLQALALWPHGAWAARRAVDGSDDPLGLAALVLFLVLLLREAPTLRLLPRTGWLAAAGLLTLAANAALAVLPPLLAGVLAALALAAGVCAWRADGAPRLPLAGLLLLALPLVASLQYYAGYPLRVVTAEASASLLQLAGRVADRSGAALVVDGRLVLVDAPCSGVQMAWLAYACACAMAGLTGLRDADFLRRLTLVGLLVLAGNVLRNSVLVALEARPQGLAPALHEAIGLVALAAVCALVLGLMRGGRDAHAA